MKTNLRSFSIVAALAGTFLIVSCGGDESPDNADTAHHHDGDHHEHTFACPMHLDVTGHKGDSCTKCGMALAHMDSPGNANTYFIQFTCNPATVESGKEVTLIFTPKIKGKETEAVALDVVHEKKMHLMIVSNDLSWFEHLHPEYQSDGSYQLKATFPQGGNYTMFADYRPTGAGQQLEKISIPVSGSPMKETTYSAAKITWNNNNVEASLNPEGGKFVTGEQLHIAGIIEQNGKEVDANIMDNWLGAKAHMVMIKTGTYEYIHVHPDVENGHLDLHATFDTPGVYRAWMQFRLNGQLYTSDFVINVEQGTGEAHDHDHGSGEHSHDHEHSHDGGHDHSH